MNRIFVFVITLSIISCTSSGQVESQQPAEAAPQQSQAAEAPKRTPIYAKPDSTAGNVYISNARPMRDIDENYPYDIDLKDGKGTIVNSSKVFKKNDKPTVLLFWLTTCVPCRYELNAISKKYASWKEEADFNLYAISTDFPKNYEQYLKRVEQENWPWETYLDFNREFMRIMPGELNGLPQTFILDKNGKIVSHKRKYRHGDEDVLFEEIKAAANKS